MSTAAGPPLTVPASDATRWGQLVFGIICMVMIAEPAIWLDAFRHSHRPKISLGPRVDPGRLHDFCADRNLAGALRRLPDR